MNAAEPKSLAISEPVGQPSYGERQASSADRTEGAAVESHADDDVRVPEESPVDELVTSSNAFLAMNLRDGPSRSKRPSASSPKSSPNSWRCAASARPCV